MGNVIVRTNKIPTTTNKSKELIKEIEKELLKEKQLILTTQHTLHGGVYTRTVYLPKDSILTNVEIIIPTTVIIAGELSAFIGEEVVHIKGYGVIPASKSRKQVFHTKTDCYMTMVFKTKAKTIKEAEEEFTEEADKLLSRKSFSTNIINITGE